MVKKGFSRIVNGKNAQFEVVLSAKAAAKQIQKMTEQKVGSERIEVMTQA